MHTSDDVMTSSGQNGEMPNVKIINLDLWGTAGGSGDDEWNRKKIK